MSFRLVADVLDYSKAEGTTLLVLLTIAEMANQDGISWPSQPTLARRARISERTIRRHTTKLIELGELEEVKRGNGRRSTVWRVRIEGGQSVHPGGSGCPPWVANVTTQGGQSGHPLVEPVSEPTNEPAPDKPTRAEMNDLWDAMERAHDFRPEAPGERSRWGKVQKELLKLGATGDDYQRRHHRYRMLHPTWADTPTAILNHWGELAPQKPKLVKPTEPADEPDTIAVPPPAGWADTLRKGSA